MGYGKATWPHNSTAHGRWVVFAQTGKSSETLIRHRTTANLLGIICCISGGVNDINDHA